MMEGEKTFTTGGAMRVPDLQTVSKWIKESWNEIDVQMIARSFKKCGISNEMDGTEDDMLWDDAEADDGNTHDNSDDEDVIYDDTLSREEMMDLFDSDSDEDEEFFGF